MTYAEENREVERFILAPNFHASPILQEVYVTLNKRKKCFLDARREIVDMVARKAIRERLL